MKEKKMLHPLAELRRRDSETQVSLAMVLSAKTDMKWSLALIAQIESLGQIMPTPCRLMMLDNYYELKSGTMRRRINRYVKKITESK